MRRRLGDRLASVSHPGLVYSHHIILPLVCLRRSMPVSALLLRFIRSSQTLAVETIPTRILRFPI